MEFNWYLRWCRIEGMRICGTTFTTMSPKWSTNRFPYVESYHPTNSILVMLWSTMRGLKRLRKEEMGDYAYWFYSASSRKWNKSHLHIGNSGVLRHFVYIQLWLLSLAAYRVKTSAHLIYFLITPHFLHGSHFYNPICNWLFSDEIW